MHTKRLQNLQWKLQVALSGSEVLKVEVYDHESVGPNRYMKALFSTTSSLWIIYSWANNLLLSVDAIVFLL